MLRGELPWDQVSGIGFVLLRTDICLVCLLRRWGRVPPKSIDFEEVGLKKFPHVSHWESAESITRRYLDRNQDMQEYLFFVKFFPVYLLVSPYTIADRKPKAIARIRDFPSLSSSLPR